MPSIHSVAHQQHLKQERIDYIKAKYDDILAKNYNNIVEQKNIEARNKDLANLMSEMEDIFNIPPLLEDAQKQVSPKILELYQEISNARDFTNY